ncbi:MAG TPA: GWxTD domain-containing protein [Gemmatimonadales bacterium]|nr:GWxTD domain-containing protein [Gemmatimonadales bacterium]
MALLFILAALVQAPADRADLEKLRDSLSFVKDSVALLRLEASTIAVAKQNRDDPLIHLRLGFIAYRLGEITKNKSHYDDAAGEFEWASELRPDWPYPWYGDGLSELAMGEAGSIAIENLRQILGKDYLSKAAKAFARATEADPSFASAVVDLANTALTQRIRPRLDVAVSAVRMAAASSAGRNPDVQLVRGRVEREAGEADSALAAFHTYLALGGDSGIGYLETARTAYFAHRNKDGWTAYFNGARLAQSPGAVALYRLDLSWIADSAELKAFDALSSPGQRAEWLDDFWSKRDAAEARDVGERLAEHYRRWFQARHDFRLVSRHRHYDITERYRSAQVEFDDRGIIYMRHGDPDRRARYVEPNVEPNESWLYHRPSGDLEFHFVARDDATDFKLVESLVDVLGFSRAVRASNFMDPQIADLYASRQNFGSVYLRVASSQHAPGRELAAERATGQRDIAYATTTDSYRRRFDLPMDVVTSEFVTGTGDTSADQQLLHVVFAIPGDRLSAAPAEAAGGLRYPLQFRLIVADSSGHVVARHDTLRVFAARQPLRHPDYLTGRIALPVPAGHYVYRLLVATLDGGAGDLVTGDARVDTLDPHRFSVSDVVVGREGSGLVWHAPSGDTVRLNPLQRFPEGSAVNLYYEIYGLARGAGYHTVVRLQREGGQSLFGAIGRLFGGGRSPVLLEFDSPSDGPITRVQRGIELRDVGKGSYRLSVTISDPVTGRSVTRTQRFQVVDR